MAWVRRGIVALLGVILILDSVLDQFRVLQFVVGLVMIGLVPIDAIVDAATRPSRDDAALDRLAEVMRDKNVKPADPA